MILLNNKQIIQYINKMRTNLARWIQPNNQRIVDKYKVSLRDWLINHQKEIVFNKVSWMGVPTQKLVLDVWIYQELLWKIKPEVVIEIGSFKGGATLYLAHLLDIIGQGTIISVDISREHYQVSHDRIITITGDSNAPETVAKVTELAQGKSTLIIHDGDHRRDPVLKDLVAYSPLVSLGSYFIVEDGVVDILGSEIDWHHANGPVAAVEAFLDENNHFIIDETCERYTLTYNPKGYLKRIK